MLTLDEALLQRLQGAMPDDPELRVRGSFFSCDVLLSSGERRFLLRFRDGTLDRITPEPHPVEAWSFAIKAPDETWSAFLQDPPPPEFHDVWAAAWLGHMTIEGDTKVFMQNHYAFWRTLKLLRATANV